MSVACCRMPTASIARRLDWAAYRALPVAPFAAAAARVGSVAAAGKKSFFSLRENALYCLHCRCEERSGLEG